MHSISLYLSNQAQNILDQSSFHGVVFFSSDQILGNNLQAIR